jgi:dienelactone hydrolase
MANKRIHAVVVSFCRSIAWLGYTIISVDIFTGKEHTQTDTHSIQMERKKRNERKLGKGKKNNKNNNNNQNNGIIKI